MGGFVPQPASAGISQSFRSASESLQSNVSSLTGQGHTVDFARACAACDTELRPLGVDFREYVYEDDGSAATRSSPGGVNDTERPYTSWCRVSG